MRRRALLAATPLLGTPLLGTPLLARAQGSSLLKFVPYTDLAVLDPIVTGNASVRSHALMVFDTLYGVDESYTPRPQMVEGHTIEADGRVWTLKLRDNLRFHDGEKVLARDCVASIRRWGARDMLGSALLAATDALSAVDDRTIRFQLKSPFPLLPFALGKSTGNVMVVMPERLAGSSPARAVQEAVGSGPYRFLAGERVQGAVNAYARFEAYVPRQEPVSLLAGGKVAHFDRVEWHTIPDAATAAAALQKGEMDWVDQPSPDYVPALRRMRGITLDILDPAGTYRYVRLNHLTPPFDNPAVRRAALAAISQADMVIAAAGADPKMLRTGVGFFAPDSPMASDEGMAAIKEPADIGHARKLLAEAGAVGAQIRVLAASSVAPLLAMGQVAAAALEQAGFKVAFEPLEIAAFLQNLSSRAPFEQRGWNVSTDSFSAVDANDPVLNRNMRGLGSAGTYGWFASTEVEALRDRFMATTDLAEQKALCRRIQGLCFDQVPYIPAGITLTTTAYSSALSRPLRGMPLFYGLRKA